MSGASKKTENSRLQSKIYNRARRRAKTELRPEHPEAWARLRPEHESVDKTLDALAKEFPEEYKRLLNFYQAMFEVQEGYEPEEKRNQHSDKPRVVASTHQATLAMILSSYTGAEGALVGLKNIAEDEVLAHLKESGIDPESLTWDVEVSVTVRGTTRV